MLGRSLQAAWRHPPAFMADICSSTGAHVDRTGRSHLGQHHHHYRNDRILMLGDDRLCILERRWSGSTALTATECSIGAQTMDCSTAQPDGSDYQEQTHEARTSTNIPEMPLPSTTANTHTGRTATTCRSLFDHHDDDERRTAHGLTLRRRRMQNSSQNERLIEHSFFDDEREPL